MTTRLDATGATCLFGGADCTEAMIGRGGLDEHHAWPRFMGGPATDGDALACPNHHRRQHALLRYLVECDQRGIAPAWPVRRRFNLTERGIADDAVRKWISAGRPPIRGMERPRRTVKLQA